MVAPGQSPQDLLPLTPAVFHILLALSDGERHGYAIMREIERSTGGMVRMGPGTLYGTIKRAMAAGLVEESDERPDPEMDDERRRYYRMTAFGRRVASAEAERLDRLVAEAKAKRLLPGLAEMLRETGHGLVQSAPGLAGLPRETGHSLVQSVPSLAGLPRETGHSLVQSVPGLAGLPQRGEL